MLFHWLTDEIIILEKRRRTKKVIINGEKEKKKGGQVPLFKKLRKYRNKRY